LQKEELIMNEIKTITDIRDVKNKIKKGIKAIISNSINLSFV
jgi:hypothetical protein